MAASINSNSNSIKPIKIRRRAKGLAPYECRMAGLNLGQWCLAYKALNESDIPNTATELLDRVAKMEAERIVPPPVRDAPDCRYHECPNPLAHIEPGAGNAYLEKVFNNIAAYEDCKSWLNEEIIQMVEGKLCRWDSKNGTWLKSASKESARLGR